jgi:hypothetical protein
MMLALPASREFEAALAAARREFAALPGLSLTADQAGRLWALEPPVCSAVLRTLVDCGDLCESERGRFRRSRAA